MKHIPITRIAVTAAAAGAMVGAAALVSLPSQAQPDFLPAIHRGAMPGHGPMGRWLRELDLTRDQREQIDALLEPMREARRQQFINGDMGPAALKQLIADGTFSRSAAVEFAELKADQVRERMIAGAEIAGTIYETVLTQAQRDALSARFAGPADAGPYADGERFSALRPTP